MMTHPASALTNLAIPSGRLRILLGKVVSISVLPVQTLPIIWNSVVCAHVSVQSCPSWCEPGKYFQRSWINVKSHLDAMHDGNQGHVAQCECDMVRGCGEVCSVWRRMIN